MRADHQQLMSSISTQSTTDFEPHQANISDDAKRYNNEIFKRVVEICPAWRQAFTSTEEAAAIRKQWLIGFSETPGLTSESIAYALKKLRHSGNPFLPTIGQFLKWCRQGMLPDGFKTAFESYREICAYNCMPVNEREPSNLSPEVFHTLVSIQDVFGWKQSNANRHREIWEEQYQKTMALVAQGGQLKRAPEPKTKLTGDTTPMTQESKQQKIEQLKQMRQGLMA